MTNPSDHRPTDAGQPTESPSDNTTLTHVVHGYREAGFTGDFWAEETGVRCGSCQSVLEAGRLNIHSLRRLEGASDPDDMMAVVALQCGVCDATGAMVLGYGPAGSDVDSDVMRMLQDGREEGELPAHSPPNETPDD